MADGWVIYWGGEAYLADPLEVGRRYRWTGNKDARVGDVAFLYATAPVSALVARFEVVSNGTPSKWAGQFQALGRPPRIPEDILQHLLRLSRPPSPPAGRSTRRGRR